MPEGLVDGLTGGELVDLVRFFTELGEDDLLPIRSSNFPIARPGEAG